MLLLIFHRSSKFNVVNCHVARYGAGGSSPEDGGGDRDRDVLGPGSVHHPAAGLLAASLDTSTDRRVLLQSALHTALLVRLTFITYVLNTSIEHRCSYNNN